MNTAFQVLKEGSSIYSSVCLLRLHSCFISLCSLYNHLHQHTVATDCCPIWITSVLPLQLEYDVEIWGIQRKLVPRGSQFATGALSIPLGAHVEGGYVVRHLTKELTQSLFCTRKMTFWQRFSWVWFHPPLFILEWCCHCQKLDSSCILMDLFQHEIFCVSMLFFFFCINSTLRFHQYSMPLIHTYACKCKCKKHILSRS